MHWLGLPIEIWGAVATVAAAVIGLVGNALLRMSSHNKVLDGGARLKRLRFLKSLYKEAMSAGTNRNGSRMRAFLRAVKSSLSVFDGDQKKALRIALREAEAEHKGKQLDKSSLPYVFRQYIDLQIEELERELGVERKQ